MKKPKTLLPNPIAKIRNVSEGNPERNSVERVREVCSWHKEPEVGKYYVECEICHYLRIEVEQTD